MIEENPVMGGHYRQDQDGDKETRTPHVYIPFKFVNISYILLRRDEEHSKGLSATATATATMY